MVPARLAPLPPPLARTTARPALTDRERNPDVFVSLCRLCRRMRALRAAGEPGARFPGAAGCSVRRNSVGAGRCEFREIYGLDGCRKAASSVERRDVPVRNRPGAGLASGGARKYGRGPAQSKRGRTGHPWPWRPGSGGTVCTLAGTLAVLARIDNIAPVGWNTGQVGRRYRNQGRLVACGCLPCGLGIYHFCYLEARKTPGGRGGCVTASRRRLTRAVFQVRLSSRPGVRRRAGAPRDLGRNDRRTRSSATSAAAVLRRIPLGDP